jgi:hypothetical protein
MLSLPETLMRGKIYVIMEAPGWSNWMPETVPGRGGRRVRQTGGKILSAHVYHNEEERWCELLPGSIFLGWWLYPIRGV